MDKTIKLGELTRIVDSSSMADSELSGFREFLATTCKSGVIGDPRWDVIIEHLEHITSEWLVAKLLAGAKPPGGESDFEYYQGVLSVTLFGLNCRKSAAKLTEDEWLAVEKRIAITRLHGAVNGTLLFSLQGLKDRMGTELFDKLFGGDKAAINKALVGRGEKPKSQRRTNRAP